MPGYYAERLSARRLQRCYEIAPPRVQQYLESEIQHVLGRIRPSDTVLELGCGHGRVLERLAPHARSIVGIDTSRESLSLARELLQRFSNCRLLEMDAAALQFPDRSFDLVVCIQNGISAFHVDPRRLIRESVRVTRPGGRALFSSYADKFWEHRLEWFRLQADHGLLGPIDWSATGNGVIVCQDGFTATTVTPQQFAALTADLPVRVQIEEVDQSSVFCELLI